MRLAVLDQLLVLHLHLDLIVALLGLQLRLRNHAIAHRARIDLRSTSAGRRLIRWRSSVFVSASIFTLRSFEISSWISHSSSTDIEAKLAGKLTGATRLELVLDEYTRSSNSETDCPEVQCLEVQWSRFQPLDALPGR
jgi:hypothetical protein